MNYEWSVRGDLLFPLRDFQHHNSFKLNEWKIRKEKTPPPITQTHTRTHTHMQHWPSCYSVRRTDSLAAHSTHVSHWEKCMLKGALFIVKLCIPMVKNTIKKSCHLSHLCICCLAQTRVGPLCTSLK